MSFVVFFHLTFNERDNFVRNVSNYAVEWYLQKRSWSFGVFFIHLTFKERDNFV
jgi:hypothetical protein